MNFSDELIEKIKQKESLVCLGLDPDPNSQDFPKYLKNTDEKIDKIILNFNKSLIDVLSDKILAIKPNLKFYEALGIENSLLDLVKYAHSKDLIVIIDSKGNDIFTSISKHYEGMFSLYKADAITVNAYMGKDVISPFIKYKEDGKGLFVLIKTSNPSSEDFQDLFAVKIEKDKQIYEISSKELNNIKLKRNYIHMAELVKGWESEYVGNNGYSSIGAVVGATNVEEMKIIRKILPKSFFLIPGYGAQGGSLKTIASGINKDGMGAVINSSRGIMYAWNRRFKGEINEASYLKAASREVDIMNGEIHQIIKN